MGHGYTNTSQYMRVFFGYPLHSSRLVTQNHIFQRCEGYVKYRSPIPVVEDQQAGASPTRVKNEDEAAIERRAADAAEDPPDRKGA